MDKEYIYLIAVMCTFFPIWLIFYIQGKDQRSEFLQMSLFVGVLSLFTCYFFWTEDWWLPENMTGTRVGLEDFLIGFFSGGVMSAGYEILLGLHDRKNKKMLSVGRFQSQVVILIMAFTVAFLFWAVSRPSALACFIAIASASVYLLNYRHDLFFLALGSGAVMLIASLPFYLFLHFLYPGWIVDTYPFDVFTGLRILHIPIEEFIFWFLAGFIFGPFYELMKGLREYHYPKRLQKR